MKITILFSSKEHPVYKHLNDWKKKHSTVHNISLLTNLDDVQSGDILFIISFTRIVESKVRKRFKHAVVIHASDLPKGRGWSPHICQILEGHNKIPVTLFEAVDEVDAGNIWTKISVEFEGHELYEEINEKLFKTELQLMDYAIENYDKIVPTPQPKTGNSYFKKRNPEDSKLDPDKTISEQFNLMRIADTKRFPCYFDLRGHRYKLILSKYDSRDEVEK